MIKEFVEYRLGSLHFAVNIMEVQEIIMPPKGVVPLPQAPPYIQGLLDIRGNVIPVVDMRIKLGVEESELTKKSRIIIVRVGRKSAGMLVDEASRIVRVEEESIQEVPEVMKDFPQTDYLKGVIRDDGKLILLLDVQKVMSEKAIIDMVELGEEIIRKKKMR